jgi:hypothetical protein
MTERVNYGRTAQMAREYGVSRLQLVNEARFHAMSGREPLGGAPLYDAARFADALRSIQRRGYIACPGYVGPASSLAGVRGMLAGGRCEHPEGSVTFDDDGMTCGACGATA